MSATVVPIRSQHLQVDGPSACACLLTMLGWGGGSIPVFVSGRQAWRIDTRDGFVDAGCQLWRRAHDLDERESVTVELGLPVQSGLVSASTVLWCWVSGSDPLRRAQRFKPAPAVVLRVGGGSERLLLWGLCERLDAFRAPAMNERIAYALRAPRTRCEPGLLRVPLPGLFMRLGRKRPAPVVATRMGLSDYTADRVAGRLKDPPSRDAWRERKT